MAKNLLLMLHGLNGNVETWGNFPKLLAADPDIADRFEVPAPYTYTTDFLGYGPSISALARELATYLRRIELADFPKIVILAHSMGGLIAKRLVADMLIAREPLRIDRIMTFASPLLGAGGASAMPVVRGPQIRDLAIGSEFMLALGHDWAATSADEKVVVRHVVGGDDAVVAPWSSTAGFRNTAYDTIGGEGHRSIVKPQNAEATAFQLARKFLLDTSPPWHRAPDSKHYEQPVLDATTLPDTTTVRNNIARFVYRARAIPFFGRKREWQILTEFLSEPDPFRWMVISGAGGTGKSRIALEFCLANNEKWYAGFLTHYERSREDRDWARWQPLVPTLLVLDYATRDPEPTQNLLHELARRTMPGAEFPLPQPVRVLLLIRPPDQRVLDEVINAGDAAIPVALTRAPQALTLREIEDLWSVFEAIFTAAAKTLPDKRATLKEVLRIDPQGRPLFAIFLADAMASTPDAQPDPRHFDTTRLLTDVIDRWRSRFWLPAFQQAKLGRGDAEETLLALATICGGIPIRTGRLPACSTPKLLPEWDPYQHPQVLEAMTGQSSREVVPPLEPDIVGEHFVFARLAQRNDGERKSLIDLAWSIDPLGTAAFIDRVSQDLPENQLRDPVFESLLRTPDIETKEVALWRSRLGVNLLNRLYKTRLPALDRMLVEMKAYADLHAEAPLRELWATGAVNVLKDLGASDPDAARALLVEMKAYAPPTASRQAPK